MQLQNKYEGILGCLVFLSRSIAIMIAVSGLIKGLATGDVKMMIMAVTGAGLYYFFIWLGVKLVIRGMKKIK